MKISEMNLKKGIVKVIPETMDDLWHLYNIIYKSDEVSAHTSREIKPDKKYARPKRGERISVFLGIKVETVSWQKFLGKLRIHGRICEAPEIVPKGSHHTLKVRLHKPMTIVKKRWARHQVERLKRASKASQKSLIIAVVDDEGYTIAITAQYGFDIKIDERINLPGKFEAERRIIVMKKFFREIANSLRQIEASRHSPIVILGVGFVKNDFMRFLKNEAADLRQRIVDVKSVNNNGVAGIYEAFRSGILLKAIKEQRIVEETEIIEKILKRLGKSQTNVTYGLEKVKNAAKLGAVEELVLADIMLREVSDEKRLLLEGMMKTVEQKRGDIMIVSTEHAAGEKLVAMGGVAALLRFATE